MKRASAALLLALAACADPAAHAPWSEPPAQPVALHVQVEPERVGLLQPLTVTIDRYRREGVEVAFAPEVDEQSFLTDRVVRAREYRWGGGLVERTVLTLRPVAGPGEVEVPSFRAETVVADGESPVEASTPPVPIVVESVLTGEYGDEIEAPGEPFPEHPNWWLWGGVGAAGLLAVAVYALWWRRRQRLRPADPLAVAVPAHVKALRELRRWRTAPRSTPAEVEAFYVGVSQVLRVYVEERFHVHAPERTTEEFLRDLEGSDALLRAHRAELERFLRQCDLVKFAAVVPGEEEHERTLALAEAFVESTRADRVGAADVAAEVPA